MTPYQVALRMLRANADPGLIAAYLRLEIERDPEVAMTPLQVLQYRLNKAFENLARAFDYTALAIRKAFQP